MYSAGVDDVASEWIIRQQEKANETIYYNVSDMKMFTFTSPTSLFASLADDFVCFT